MITLEIAYENAQEEYCEARERYLALHPFSKESVRGYAAAYLVEVKGLVRDAALEALNNHFAPYRVGAARAGQTTKAAG